MSRSFWELLLPIIAVAISLIKVAKKKEALEEIKDKKNETQPLSQITADHTNFKGRAVYEGYLSQMYPQGEKLVSFSEKAISKNIVAGSAASVAKPESEPVPEVVVKKSVLKNSRQKERPTTPLVEFSNPAAIIQGIIFSEVLFQPKAKNKFRYR